MRRLKPDAVSQACGPGPVLLVLAVLELDHPELGAGHLGDRARFIAFDDVVPDHGETGHVTIENNRVGYVSYGYLDVRN